MPAIEASHCQMCLSVPQIPVASTRISTSACPGFGTGTWRISVAEGPGAAFVLTTAVIFAGILLPAIRQSPAWSSRTKPPRGPAASASACTDTGLTYLRTMSRVSWTRSFPNRNANFFSSVPRMAERVPLGRLQTCSL